MNLAKTLAWGMLLAMGGIAGCRPAHESSGPSIVTTTSYLESVARELLGDDVTVVRLAEPGTCPGHFDIRPSQVEELRRCSALLRFDFQSSLDARLAGYGGRSMRPAVASVKGGLCRPDTYLLACRQIAAELATCGVINREASDERLLAVATRLDALSLEITNAVAQAGLAGLPVITSAHQRDFCEWLGLKVVAAFRTADNSSVGEIEDAIAAGRLHHTKFVVANLPEGRRVADALAGRLQARVLLFENFPALEAGRVSFDSMVRNNLRALIQSTAP